MKADELEFYPAEEQYAVPYKCAVLEWGAREPKPPNKTLQVFLILHCKAYWDVDKKEWSSLDEPGLNNKKLVADITVIKTDGSVSPTGFDQIQRALKLGPDFLAVMADKQPPSDLLVVVDTAIETYQEKQRLRVGWVNAEDHTPGSQGIARQATSEKLKAMNEIFGSMFRALSGPTPPSK